MSKGKTEFLRSLKEAVAHRKKAQASERFALGYLKRWSKGLGESLDKYDHAWFKRFLDLLDRRHRAELNDCEGEVGKLFGECELNLSNPADKDLLLAALAQTVYPRAAGAKQKWDEKYYDQLWHDILSTEEKRVSAEPSHKAIAEELLRSKNVGTRYRSRKRGVEEAISPDSLRRRVSDALNAGLSKNPNLRIWDFDYILRGDPDEGPACAAGLPFQPAFPPGSILAQQAASLEQALLADVQAFFESLDLFMTEGSKFHCRLAARRMARRRVRQCLRKP